jgi:hypothetical protein
MEKLKTVRERFSMNDQKQQGVGRREFLFMTSGTVLAAVALGQVNFSSPASGRSVSLGYADSDAAKSADDRFVPNVISADRVSSGDGGFLRGVRVSLRGFNVTPKVSTGRKNIQLITNYTVAEGGLPKLFPFVAWSYTKSSGAGHRLSYIVPLDQDQHLRLLLKTDLSATETSDATVTPSVTRTRRNLLSNLMSEAANSSVDPDAITLSIIGEKGTSKLRRGYYIIAPTVGGASEPDWSRFQVRRGENGLKLFAMDGFDAAPADFEYLILQVDYLPAPDAETPVHRPSKSK